jgi:tetratricopeptide (TPR) repeat protein
LAVTLRAFGETDKAIREFEKACQSDPNYPDPYYGLGTAWKDKGDFQRAIDFYSQYLTHDSKGSFAGEARQLINELKQRQLAQRSTLTEEGHSSKTYRDREGRFSFDYPGNWAVLTRDELSAKTKGIITEANPNLVLAIGNPDDWDENATLQINPGALGTQNPDKEQIDELAKLMDEEMPVYCKDFMKVSHRVFQLDGAPALEYIMVNTRMNVWFQSKEILVFKRDRTLILTCTAKMETFGKIDECCFQTIIKSLQAQ